MKKKCDEKYFKEKFNEIKFEDKKLGSNPKENLIFMKYSVGSFLIFFFLVYTCSICEFVCLCKFFMKEFAKGSLLILFHILHRFIQNSDNKQTWKWLRKYFEFLKYVKFTKKIQIKNTLNLRFSYLQLHAIKS